MFTKKELFQGCINLYKGEYGKPRIIFNAVKDFKVDNVEGRFGYMADQPHTLWINFQGSNGGKDWRDNFKSWKKRLRQDNKKIVPYDGMNKKIKVHTGISNQYKKVQAIIHTEIANTRPKKIVVFGHSLGAGNAVMCAVDINYNFPGINLLVIPYGCLRVGNKAFAKSYNRRVPNTIRVVNGLDLICKLPFAKLGYYHVGRLCKIGARPWYKLFSITDHYPEKYMENL